MNRKVRPSTSKYRWTPSIITSDRLFSAFSGGRDPFAARTTSQQIDEIAFFGWWSFGPASTGHYKVNAAEEFLSFGCFRTEHRLVSAYINRIINVAWCFGHGILLDPEAGILCPFQPVLQGGNCEIRGSRPRLGDAAFEMVARPRTSGW